MYTVCLFIVDGSVFLRNEFFREVFSSQIMSIEVFKQKKLKASFLKT